jgi:SNF2 family DNA or RNA helicase
VTAGLWPHQKESLAIYRRTPIVLDTSDPGTGKTRAAIEAYKERRRAGGGCALVVAPKSLLEPAWGEDIKKFAPSLRFSVAYAHNRQKAFEHEADVYITNTDAATWLAKQKPKFFEHFDTLIIDEISYFKHHTSKRSKAMKKISKYFEYRAGLTGTPTSNGITDIWHQVMILDGGEHLGPSFWKFRDVVCKPVVKNPAMPQYTEWHDRPGAHEEVAEILGDISIRHKFEEVMKHVPGQRAYTVHYKPSAKLLKLYHELREQTLLMLEEGDVDAVNAAVLRQKLLQLCSGTVYGKNKVHKLDDGRTELITELVSDRKHSIVFYNWDHQRQSLVEVFTKKKIPFVEITRDTKDRDRNRIVQEYQAGQYQTILMHPQTGAHGLTLTKGTSVIWCSPSDRADLITQGDARVKRGGQTLKTESIRVCAVGTLEEQVYERTGKKLDAMNELMEMLQ